MLTYSRPSPPVRAHDYHPSQSRLVPGRVYCVPSIYTHYLIGYPKLYDLGITIPIFQLRKLSLREVKKLAQLA